MNGPEHYREAERLLFEVQHLEAGSNAEPGLLAEAQVHATLALAAAVGTLDAAKGPGGGSVLSRPSRDGVEWDRVTYAGAGGHR